MSLEFTLPHTLPHSLPNIDDSLIDDSLSTSCQKLLELDAIGVNYLSCGPTYFRCKSDPSLKIGIPLTTSSLHVKWETGNGKQKHQFVKEGSVSIIPPNLSHEAWLESQMEIMIFKLTPNLLEQIAKECQGCSIEIEAKWSVSDPLIRQLALSLFREFQHGVPGNLYVESIGHILATHVLRRYSIQGQVSNQKPTNKISKHKFKQAVEYINDNLSQDITLAELANLVDMNQYQFTREFKVAIGTSPHKYLLERRIEQAKELLSRTQISIAEISYNIGFSSQSHFTSTFRRLTGTTPAFYRKSS